MSGRPGDYERNRGGHISALLSQTDYLEDEVFGKMVRIAMRDELRKIPMRTIRGHDELTLYEWTRKVFGEWIVNA